MAGVSERNRQRIAIALFALSLCLILIGFGIILQNLSAELPGPVATRPANVPPAVKEKAFALKWMLLWLLIFGLILAVSTLAFLRWSRRFRRLRRLAECAQRGRFSSTLQQTDCAPHVAQHRNPGGDGVSTGRYSVD